MIKMYLRKEYTGVAIVCQGEIGTRYGGEQGEYIGNKSLFGRIFTDLASGYIFLPLGKDNGGQHRHD